MQTDIHAFIEDLDGGVFEEKLSRVLSEVAAGVIDHHAKGSVQLTFDMTRIGSSYQVAVKHKLSYTKPTSKGKASEEATTETPMHVGEGGRLSLFPEKQGQMFGKHGETIDTDTGEIKNHNG